MSIATGTIAPFHRVYVMEGPIMKARHNNFHDVSER